MTISNQLEPLFELFKAKAEAVGAEVHRFAGRTAALDFLLPLLREEGVKEAAGSYAVWADSPILKSADPRTLALVKGLHLEVTREKAAESLVGVSQVHWALADTGTLVQDQSAVEQRLASSLPAIHIAIVGTHAILPDKSALLSRIDPRKSRFIAFITGPSRTADIERVLTIGVHGPKRLIILAVDGLGGESR